jgi:formylmethanofuran dehydrogenase subunit E
VVHDPCDGFGRPHNDGPVETACFRLRQLADLVFANAEKFTDFDTRVAIRTASDALIVAAVRLEQEKKPMTDHTESEVAEIHGYANTFPTGVDAKAATRESACDVCGEPAAHTNMVPFDLDLCAACVDIVERESKADELGRALERYPGLKDRHATAQAKKRAE